MKLLLGGSPCTHWSIAKTGGRETEPSGIGWELFKNFVIARDKYRPDYFLYENVRSMSNAIRDRITEELGVEPIMIDSALVSAQRRQRLYWTNIPDISHPEDRGILLRDILETGIPVGLTDGKAYSLKSQYYKSAICNLVKGGGHYPQSGVAIPVNVTPEGKAQCLRATYYKDGIRNMIANKVDRRSCVAIPIRIGTIENSAKNPDNDSQQYRVYSPDGKSVALKGNGGGLGAKTGLYAVPVEMRWADGKVSPIYEVWDGYITIKGERYPIKLEDGYYVIRKLTVLECARLQTVPEDYIFPVSSTQAYKLLGNGWTVDVIAHILGHIQGITAEPVEALSMYDGMSCGRLALEQVGAKVSRYYATEIDKYAIAATQANFPDTIQLGDAFQVRDAGWGIERSKHETSRF